MSEKENDEIDWNFLSLFALAVVLDIIFKQLPYLTPVQPILPITVIAGILYGAKKGIAVGVLAAIISNLLFYSASAFTGSLFLLQISGAFIAGILGGIAGSKGKPSTAGLISITIVIVVFFEALNNFLQGAVFARLSGYYYLEGTALASALHLVIAILLALMLSDLIKEKK